MKKALLILLAVCQGALTFAGVREGVVAMQRGDYKAAYNEFHPLALQGDDKAMLTIGIFFQKGQGFPVDYKKAMYWYLKALEKKNYNAMNNIGVLYRDGLGVERDLVLAYALFKTSLKNLRYSGDRFRAEKNLEKTEMIISRDAIETASQVKEDDLAPEKLRKHVPGSSPASYRSLPVKSLKQLAQSYTLDMKKTEAAYKDAKIRFVYNNDYTEYPGFIGRTIGQKKDLQKDTIKDGFYVSNKGRFRIMVPKLSTGEVAAYQTSRGNNAENEVKFFEKGIEPLQPWPTEKGAWHAVVIATEVPDELRKQKEKVLEIMEKTQKSHVSWLPSEVYSLKRSKGRFGETIQLVVLNRIPSKVYPQTDVCLSPLKDGLKTIGVNRLFVMDNSLMEVGIIVAKPAKMDNEKFVKYAMNQMDVFMGGLEGSERIRKPGS